MECGCKVEFKPSWQSDHHEIVFCHKHAAADAMLTKLIEIKEELQDRYDYSEDADGIDESPWNGAGNLIHELEALIRSTSPQKD